MSTEFDFNQPGASDGGGGGGFVYVKPAEVMGHLLLILKVHSNSGEQLNRFNDTEVRAVVDFVDLDGDQTVVHNAVFTARYISNRFPAGGTNILGRVAKGPANDKGKPANVFNGFNDADRKQAAEWVAKNALEPAEDDDLISALAGLED